MEEFERIEICVDTNAYKKGEHEEEYKEGNAYRVGETKRNLDLTFIWKGNSMHDFLYCAQRAYPSAKQFIPDDA